MTTITAPPATPAAAKTGAATGTVSNLTSATDQQDRFMKLLVAQMKNQDPLNPMDNAQMTSQVAQINTVGGIEKLNRTVESLLAAFSGMQSQQAQLLAGRDVLVEGSQLALAGGKATGGVQLPADADAVQVEILDAAGQVVQTLPLGKSGAGVHTVHWDGVKADGTQAADGTWRMRVAATAGGKPVGATLLTQAHVNAVTPSADGPQLDLGPLGIRPYSDVRSFL